VDLIGQQVDYVQMQRLPVIFLSQTAFTTQLTHSDHVAVLLATPALAGSTPRPTERTVDLFVKPLQSLKHIFFLNIHILSKLFIEKRTNH
jgi:hypothetical protein